MNLKKLEDLVTESKTHLDRAKSYLESRKLGLFTDVGYLPFYQIEDLVISDSLILPVYSPKRELILVETRPLTGPKSSYRKLTADDANHIPCYNITSIPDWRLITEGILNAECLNQIPENKIPASATLTASFSNRVMHYLAAGVNQGLILALDNDHFGLQSAKRCIDFYSELYPKLSIQLLDFPYGDLNEFKIKKGIPTFNKHILNQLRLLPCK